MPLKRWDTKADYDTVYQVRTGFYDLANRRHIKVNYNRVGMMLYHTNRAKGLVRTFGWGSDTKLFIHGCGFGWTAEALTPPLNLLNIMLNDNSPYIQGNKDGSEEMEINDRLQTKYALDPNSGLGLQLKNAIHAKQGNTWARRSISLAINDLDMSNNADRNKVSQELGTGYVVLTESVLESLTDAECVDLSNYLNSLKNHGQIIHYVVTDREGKNPGFNWKTLSDWKTLIPADTFCEAHTYKVL